MGPKVRDIKLLENIAKMRKIIRKKHQALKTGKMHEENILLETFKPITDPLEQISMKIKTDKEDGKRIESVVEENVKTPIPFEHMKKDETVISSTPRTSRQRRTLKRAQLQNLEDESFTLSDSKSPSASNSIHLHKSLNDIFGNPISPKELDTKYGIRYDAETDSFKIGNAQVSIDDDILRFEDKTYHLTPGLYNLIVLRDPKSHMYTKDDLKVYGEILSYTNAYRRKYKPNHQIQAGRSKKYKNIIKNLITYRSGTSLMKLPKENTDYIYWDDPNELVDRLRLLIASQQAGHTSHNNEIISIIEELKEADIIE